MSLDFSTKSANFTGTSENLLKEIDIFLAGIKSQSSEELHLVHALVFPKSMTEKEIKNLNIKLGELYRKHRFHVLGGDTSSGKELSVFISAISC